MKKHLLMLLLAAQPAYAQTQSYDFIRVTGEAEIKVKPEFATLNVTVFSRAPSAQVAQQMNAKEMARVEKVLKSSFKIEPRDIQTSVFQVAPQYEYQKERPVYKGMSVTHTVNVKYRKIDLLGSLLDQLLAGEGQEKFGVRIEDLSFGTDRLREHQAQALEQAMSNAKARAQVLAKAGGKSLKDVRKISDTFSRSDIEPLRGGMKAASFASMAEDAPTQISSGELSVRAQVQVEFEAK